MKNSTGPNLENVSETLLITLYARARESQRPDAILKDERAISIVKKFNYDFEHIRLLKQDQLFVILRMRKFDNIAKEFLTRNPDGIVIHIGCGLDTRFERVDNDRVEWFDLDLPEVIEIRNSFIQIENKRYHLISGSVFNSSWLSAVNEFHDRPSLFMAEGVFPYFEESQVKELVGKIKEIFPQAELVFDGHSSYTMMANNAQLSMAGIRAQFKWRFNNPHSIETWGNGIQLLEEWFYLDDPEPRLWSMRWMKMIPGIAKSSGVFHYRLG